VNTGTARIIIIVALLVTGGLVLANGFGGGETAAADASPESGTTTPTPTETATQPADTSTNPPKPKETVEPAAPGDTVIAVYNGTYQTGLAGIELTKLLNKGYTAPADPEKAAVDAAQKPVEQTVVYFVPGPDADQNRVSAEALAEKHFTGAKVREVDPDLTGDVDKSVQVIVMLGVDSVADTAA
jgi:hypothetical protein